MYKFSVIGFKTTNSECAEVSEHDKYDSFSAALRRAQNLRGFYRVDIYKESEDSHVLITQLIHGKET